jgi:hypothetical protein
VNPLDRAPEERPGITRRGFLKGAAALVGGLVAGPPLWAAEQASGPSKGGKGMRLRNIRHVTVDYDRRTYCGRPRQCGIKAFGGGDMAVLYWRGACAYEAAKDVSDSLRDGWLGRAEVVLRRSRDDGETWSPREDVIFWSNAQPAQEQAAFLCKNPADRAVLDMSRPEAMFFFGRSPIKTKRVVELTKPGWTCETALAETKRDRKAEANPRPTTVFQIRSADKGRTWESAPLVLDAPPGAKVFLKDNHPLATMPDGALVGAVESERALWLYGSECQGMTWQYLSMIAMENAEAGRPCSAGLVLLSSGRLQCYMQMTGGRLDALCLSESDDCFAWSEPRPIAGNAHAPWPLRLLDGRIVVVFSRHGQPSGIAAVVSEDDGRTWSGEALIRDDASGEDIGHPVATQIGDGRVFTAYQYQMNDGNGLDGTRFVGGSIFDLA